MSRLRRHPKDNDLKKGFFFGGVYYPVEALTFAQIQAIGPAFWKATNGGDQDTWYLSALVMIQQVTKLEREEIAQVATSMPEIANAISRIAIVAGLATEPKPEGEGNVSGEAIGEAPSL